APFWAVYVDGAVRSADYACDLPVPPEWRGSGLYKQVYQHIEAWSLGRGEDLGFTTVMKGNRAMARIVAGRAGVVPYHHITTMRNFTVHFLFKKRPLPGITIRPATAADIPEMVALWSRLNSQKQFAPFLTVDSFQARLAASPGLAIGDYRLAHHDDRLVGSLALWNQESFKRMVVLKLNGGATWMRRWYNPIARLLGLARFPAPGNTMPYVYATQLCAETAHDLKALYTHVYNESIGPETFFISSMLDVRDPLITALDGFLKQTVDIEVYAMDPYRKWVGHPFNRLPVYFDPAIV
ncbi:MAG: hypothetical protein H7338_25075, partial [Candidatus Sericytochromatia bacterium]|nr:hypothetical protein [Candidatus Sericytochromatia bacterium]